MEEQQLSKILEETLLMAKICRLFRNFILTIRCNYSGLTDVRVAYAQERRRFDTPSTHRFAIPQLFGLQLQNRDHLEKILHRKRLSSANNRFLKKKKFHEEDETHHCINPQSLHPSASTL